MQVPIIKNFISPHTLKQLIEKNQEKELLLLKLDGIFANKIHGQVLRD